MTASGQSERIRSVLEPVVSRAGYVLEDVTLTPAGRRRVLRVVVDLPEDATGALELDAVAAMASSVSTELDASPVMGGQPYVLEVTSPGVDRPLTLRRHWMRNRERMVEADLHDGTSVHGRVRQVSDAGVTLDLASSQRLVGWEDLRRGRVQVEFSRPAADDASQE